MEVRGRMESECDWGWMGLLMLIDGIPEAESDQGRWTDGIPEAESDQTRWTDGIPEAESDQTRWTDGIPEAERLHSICSSADLISYILKN